MLTSVVGVAPAKLYTAALGRTIGQKTVALRVAFKPESGNLVGLGEIEALLFKNSKGENWVVGQKALPRPIGPPCFDVDYFRKATKNLWTLPLQSKISKGIVAFNTEPGLWVLSPEEDMALTSYRKLLVESPWSRIRAARDSDAASLYGEGSKVDRAGLDPLDQIIIGAIQNFIVSSLRRIGITKYEDEILHLDNDINRARLYLKNYREDEKNLSRNDFYIKQGTFKRAKSLSASVLRPTSELFRVILVKDIAEKKAKSVRLHVAQAEQHARQLQEQADRLKAFIAEEWPGFPVK